MNSNVAPDLESATAHPEGNASETTSIMIDTSEKDKETNEEIIVTAVDKTRNGEVVTPVVGKGVHTESEEGSTESQEIITGHEKISKPHNEDEESPTDEGYHSFPKCTNSMMSYITSHMPYKWVLIVYLCIEY